MGSGAGGSGLGTGIGSRSGFEHTGGVGEWSRADRVLVRVLGLGFVTSHPNFILADRFGRLHGDVCKLLKINVK